MDPKREHPPKKKKDTVRFVVISPKPSNRMKLSDRLFRPESAGPLRNVRTKVPLLESDHPNLSFSQRLISILLAGVSLCAGLAIIVLAIQHRKWVIALLGPFAIWYGLAWVRVAHDGRLPGGRLRLNPWGRE